MSIAVALPIEKPRNGLAGLKNIRHDILSGIVVSLVSLPLSSGIAIASGVPPIHGLISAIISGLVFPFVGGAYLTIAGPAAGLAPAIMAVMVSLGGAGDAETLGAGYPFLLVVIFLVGICQLIISMMGLARYAAMIPVAVVEGMLASIGLMIMAKQFAAFFGYTGPIKPHEFYEYVLAIPQYAMNLTGPVFGVSLVTLILLFVLGKLQKKVRFLQIIPPQLVAVVIGVIIGQMLGLGAINNGKFLIHIPSNLLNGVHPPHFAELLGRRDLWYAAAMGVVMLTMIDGVESLATAMAIDRIDPFKRRSDPNRLLLAMGIANLASSMVGGLTIIPGGVKSKANVAAGGRTLWANFTNAICLILYLVVGYQLINLIPLGVLAAVLIYTGWKMCEPLVWSHMAHTGYEQLAIFTITIVATLATDLLIGIGVGAVANLILNTYLCRKAAKQFAVAGVARPSIMDLFANPVGHKEWKDGIYHIHVDKPVVMFNSGMLKKELESLPEGTQEVVLHMDQPTSLWESLIGFFQNPIVDKEMVDGEYHVTVNKPLVSFNSMKLSEELLTIPEEATSVFVHIDPRVLLIDHTSADQLHHVVSEAAESDRPIQVVGLDRMRSLAHHESATRVANPGEEPNPAS